MRLMSDPWFVHGLGRTVKLLIFWSVAYLPAGLLQSLRRLSETL